MPPASRRRTKRPSLRPYSTVLAEASPSQIGLAARQLQPMLAGERWLTLNNRYLHQAPQKIRSQLGNRKTLTHRADSDAATQLAQYVAASTILHCSDGWSYLARAMAAQLRGDLGGARHLAYYAELRAALSLLAAQGLGVFGSPHVIVKDNGDVELFTHEGTHPFAWHALEAWTDLTASGDLFGRIIQPSDARMSDWLAPLVGPALSQETGSKYLRYWGVDVKRYGRDRLARNDSSYQPRTILGAAPPPSTRAAEFSLDFWQLFEPDGATNFGLLDRYLLRRTLRNIFKVRTNKSALQETARFAEFFEPALDAVQSAESKAQLADFLTAKSFAEEPPLFAEAETHSKMEDPEDHLQVIARGALLLRVSSGAARLLLEEAGLGYLEYEWWARQLAVTRALQGNENIALTSPDSLWGDIEQALVDLDDKIVEGSGGTYAELNDQCAQELSMLGGCERIALWGLAA